MDSSFPPSFREIPPTEWDSYDLCCYLGIHGIQPEEVREKAFRISRTTTDPEERKIRSGCVFPYLARTPKFHQLWCVAQYFSQAYSGDKRIRDVRRFIIADDTGLGKTTEMAMILAYRLFICVQQRNSADFMAPVMRPRKPYVFPTE